MLSEREEQLFVELRKQLEVGRVGRRQRRRTLLRAGLVALFAAAGSVALLSVHVAVAFVSYCAAVAAVNRFVASIGPFDIVSVDDWLERHLA